ncbi:MAG: hypothetical protein HW416_524, partial [Chloroflexi bacterium]|nr:hypothetical protein [Chloroflexota bacterium]
GGEALNPLTGQLEPNGTSILDVTDPRAPRYLSHIPGASALPGESDEAGGAQMVRLCGGGELPNADPNKWYLLRTRGNDAHEIWDVTDPSAPTLRVTVIDGLNFTHKNWWECDTGIAYLVSDGRPDGWRTRGMTKIYDLSDPENPRFIRDFGLVGQEPGATGATPPQLHGMIRLGDRVYFAYGINADGIVQIVDRTALLEGNPELPPTERFAPSNHNLLYPQVGRLDMSPAWGAHTTFPVLGMQIPSFVPILPGTSRDFLVLVSEALGLPCRGFRHLAFLVDISAEDRPFSVANFQVREGSDYCNPGRWFGPHATNESFSPIYYGRLVFLSYFNAGVRAVDIRDPFNPREAAFFVPAVNENTLNTCVSTPIGLNCLAEVQTNNVEVDDRGYIYIVDRASSGMHILELTGAAREIANFPSSD